MCSSRIVMCSSTLQGERRVDKHDRQGCSRGAAACMAGDGLHSAAARKDFVEGAARSPTWG